MTKYLYLFLLVFCFLPGQAQRTDTLRAVPLKQVKTRPGFWHTRLEVARTATIPHAFHQCEETGRIHNFAVAGKLAEGTFQGTRFDDSDVFKVVEGAAYSLQNHYDPALDRYLDSLITLFAAAQQPNGYLYTIRTIYGDSTGLKDWIAGPHPYSFENGSHELYNVGHLYEAAVAHYEATGKRSLLEVAIKNANHLIETIGPKPGQLVVVPGHEEIEIGLVKLYQVTGQPKYLELAKFFVDMRGRSDKRPLFLDAHQLGPTYFQDQVPVAQQTEAQGHAVRAQYLYAALADLALLQNDTSYRRVAEQIWQDAATRKQYITGGVGARADGEAFDDAYLLPNDSAYAETCAAIANMLWSHRMYLLSGETKYLDVFERVLYNAFLGGMSLEGTKFFYVNPMSSNGVNDRGMGVAAARWPWYSCACCPSNVTRFLPSLPGYLYATRGLELRVNHFVASEVEVPLGPTTVKLTQETNYPWEGTIKLTVAPEKTAEFPLLLRVPAWATAQPVPGDLYRNLQEPELAIDLKINGKKVPARPEQGYLRINRKWKAGDVVTLQLAMPVRKMVAHEQVRANVGKVAIERGPVVYCAEGADNGGRALSLSVRADQTFTPTYRSELLEGVTVLQATGPTPLTLIPYYAWSNRGPSEMAVWFNLQK
ncbi:glycoside hydrolase family 127 protein [Rhabdobacter roseus]|uniref:Glycoside hydrolase family 127 protein n=1 Tax=Rhabdobacter roseus TaxID=1655419 RepID=A0A840THJ5_9BACT|nr:beta-L-arabinofuranosidase domain-containing protein [Rhabdobacter roseus]MBB5283626.1 hypothetical protein [Rhabdobacter roseus]